MINFIICDDNKSIVKDINTIIDSYMMSNNIEYQKYNFYDYDKKFKDIIDNKMPSKIYILDIETPSGSGIDMARQIRQEDINSVIIFLTGHNDLGDIILKNDLLFLSFINKFDDYQKRLISSIKKSIKIIGQRQALHFKESNVIYTISLQDIYYICKNKIDRKTIIVTDYKEFVINKTLKEIKNELNDDFIYTHKSCIVNKNKVSMIDKKKKEIIFTNGTSINLVSRKYVYDY